MLVGYVWGKRYTGVQGEFLGCLGKGDFYPCSDCDEVFSVAMLTIGIIMAAMADAQSKVRRSLSHHIYTFPTRN